MEEKLKKDVIKLAEKAEKEYPILAGILYTFLGCEAAQVDDQMAVLCLEISKTLITKIDYVKWVENG